MSFRAVKQLYEMLGNYRLGRVVKRSQGGIFVYEFEHGDDRGRVIWVAWSPMGIRTNEKDKYVPRVARMTLGDLPGVVDQVVGMATTGAGGTKVKWEKSDSSAVTLEISESPSHIVMSRAGTGPAVRN